MPTDMAMPPSMVVETAWANAYMVSPTVWRNKVAVVTSNTMEKEMTQSVKFSRGTFHGQANICMSIITVKMIAIDTTWIGG